MPKLERSPEPKLHPLLEKFINLYGFERELFENYQIFYIGKKRSYIGTQNLARFSETKNLQACGIAFSRTHDRYAKISTTSAQRFGHHATRNRVNLTEKQLDDYINREIMSIEPWQFASAQENTYLLACFGQRCLGTAYVKEINTKKSTLIKSLFPKAWNP